MELTIEDAFLALHQKMVAELRRKAKTMDYTLSQLEVLCFVIAEKNPTMKDIASHLRITAPSATVLVDYLNEQKLLIRKNDAHDRRGVRVYPTQKTLKLFSKLQTLKKAIFSKIVTKLDNDDRETLAAILNKLN